MNRNQKVLTVIAVILFLVNGVGGPEKRIEWQLRGPNIEHTDYRQMITGFFVIAVAYTALMFVLKSPKA